MMKNFKRGFNVDFNRLVNNKTYLHVTVDHKEAFAYLLKKFDINLDHQDNNGNTVMHLSAINQNYKQLIAL